MRLKFEDDPTPILKGGDTRERKARSRHRITGDRIVIAWDGEGIKLSGNDHPQHYVLFGCSAEPHTPLVVADNKKSLRFEEIADYMCDISDAYPNAIHVGYMLKYDHNMIIRSLGWQFKAALYDHNKVKWTHGDAEYYIEIRFGKSLYIRRTRNGKVSKIRLEDMGPFFASSFVKAYEKMFSATIAEDKDWQIVVNGKLNRAETTWADMPLIRQYWETEIAAMHKLCTAFRDLMVDAGFTLGSWYGPGALANYIRRKYKLVEHEWGGKEENIPGPVHHACKMAYFGGHFEQYLGGRITGPIYGLDINSAYPYAFTQIPTMREGGFWVHTETPNPKPGTFGVYRITYRDESAFHNGHMRRNIVAPQPLPHRDRNGEVRYLPWVEGWFWRPETDMVTELYGDNVYIHEGWEWIPADDEKPWADVLIPMFERRKELKAVGDPSEMAFKLGPNSLYGKMAQRVGRRGERPSSHTLCIAGYITSFCRAMVMRLIAQHKPGEVIAVETDGVYTTRHPDTLDLPTGQGKELGQWGVDVYDEILYVQNGMYWKLVDGKVKEAKSRGIPADRIKLRDIEDLLEGNGGSMPANRNLRIRAGEDFLGLGLAMGRSRNSKGQVNVIKASRIHCSWVPAVKDIDPRNIKSKRAHSHAYCETCKAGLTMNQGAHAMMVTTPATRAIRGLPHKAVIFDPVTEPYRLPWEAKPLFDWQKQTHIDTADPLGE